MLQSVHIFTALISLDKLWLTWLWWPRRWIRWAYPTTLFCSLQAVHTNTSSYYSLLPQVYCILPKNNGLRKTYLKLEANLKLNSRIRVVVFCLSSQSYRKANDSASHISALSVNLGQVRQQKGLQCSDGIVMKSKWHWNPAIVGYHPLFYKYLALISNLKRRGLQLISALLMEKWFIYVNIQALQEHRLFGKAVGLFSFGHAV